MAPKKRSSRLRPKSPARVRKAKRSRSVRKRQHPELLGLGLFCVGIFLAVVLWLGWDGGLAGGKIERGLDGLVGDAAVAVPLVLALLGGLMVARAGLVDVRPFRTGLTLASIGLMTLLGEERGGAVGQTLDLLVGRLLGGTGMTILGLFLLAAGGLLVTGASLGAIVRRSAQAARETASVARRSVERVRVAQPAMTRGLTPEVARRARSSCDLARDL
jgi:hypothetical protein